ncbi:hypothetical protein AMEX_G24763 [Astyanax mexicanus]|uniref:Ig-like domain-containing protein n=1 Tax=Astyanax mexicanus TaxID=7994 RepID=A0A8T2KTC9_ASTMX|nr:hypothetical protein AMEX_G24763 [Astyanax mexicanus]
MAGWRQRSMAGVETEEHGGVETEEHGGVETEEHGGVETEEHGGGGDRGAWRGGDRGAWQGWRQSSMAGVETEEHGRGGDRAAWRGWRQRSMAGVETEEQGGDRVYYSCCLGSKTMIGYRGETADIRCSYPEEFQINYKTFYKWDGQNFSPVISTNQSQKDRFSTFDDRRSNVARMRIRDVREDDGGLYSCAVEVVGESITYYTRYTRIQLMVKGFFTFIIIISVSICVVLLLIGGLTLIFYKLRCSKTQDVPITSRQLGTTDTIYENDLPGNQNNLRLIPDYQNLKKNNSNQSDLGYQRLDPRSRDPNSVYHTLNPKANQIQSVRD